MKEQFLNFVPISDLREGDYWYESGDFAVIETQAHKHAIRRVDIVSIDPSEQIITVSKVDIGEDHSTEEDLPYYTDDEYYGIWRMMVSDEEVEEAKKEVEKWISNDN